MGLPELLPEEGQSGGRGGPGSFKPPLALHVIFSQGYQTLRCSNSLFIDHKGAIIGHGFLKTSGRSYNTQLEATLQRGETNYLVLVMVLIVVVQRV